MNTVEHYGEEKKKVNEVLESKTIERQRRLDAVESFLKGQESGGVSRDELLEYYFKKYKDILESQLVEGMKTAERLELLKDIIYKHEILHEEAENLGMKKAA
ncbi:MAG TPA: hypothetical protein VK254_01390 [Candidatus Bathyarchaeia archaeon]|nr:hypothetical protein [Candidatus Bathyarchaeia archaeon]